MLKLWWDDIITVNNPYHKINREIYLPGAPVVIKTQYDAFYKTDLKRILNEYNTDQIVITGVMTNLCCETTARSAFTQGYKVFFVIDGTATQNDRMHLATILNLSYGFAKCLLSDDLIGNRK